MNCSVIDLMYLSGGLFIFVIFMLTATLFLKKQLNKNRLSRFFGILTIGTLACLIPMGPLSMALGFPAVLLSSILVSLFLDKEG